MRLEVLYTLMGPGCRRVWCTRSPGSHAVTGLWEDGRLGSVRGLREGATPYGFVAFGERGSTPPRSIRPTSTGSCSSRSSSFRTGKSPLGLAVTLEIVAFLEAAGRSEANGGAAEGVEV